MASRSSPLFGIEPQSSRSSSNIPPPPPRFGEGPRPGSLRRSNVNQLPALTTNLSSRPAHPQLLTPRSTSSLSSPFTHSNPATWSADPGSGSRDVSPMASRMSGYNAAYNPSEWAGGSRRASQSEGVNRNPEDGLVAPPPPYSPPKRRTSGAPVDSSVISPGEASIWSNNASLVNTPATTTGALSPQTSHENRNSTTLSQNRSSTYPAKLPPPPPRDSGSKNLRPQMSDRNRPMSVSSLSQVMTMSSQFGKHPETGNSAYDTNRPPAATRAASTGALSFDESQCSSKDATDSRSSSRSRGWHPGMPLPGPPPGIPPTSSRSNSANKATDDNRRTSPGPSARLHSYRVPLKPPMLSPMPPTPAGWTEDQPIRSARPTIPLHIVTTNLGSASHQRDINPATEPIQGESSAAPLSFGGLNRRSAVRDTSAKGLRERRNLRRSMQGADFGDISSLTVNTNPWASAMTSAASTNRSPTEFSDTPEHLNIRNDYAVSSPIGESSKKSASRAKYFRSDYISSPHPGRVFSPKSPVIGYPRLLGTSSAPLQYPTKMLPTPPLSQKAPMSAQSILPSTTTSVADSEPTDRFAIDSLRRHRDFLTRESKATNDTERFRLFADYMVAESVLRQQRYAASLASGEIDLSWIRRRLFDASDEAAQQLLQAQPNLDTPLTAGSSNVEEGAPPETMWWKEYRPALSPIASMSNDEMSSRGRTSSRWWESEAESQSQGGTKQMRRSKRESKYMGLSTTLMQSSIVEQNTPTNLEYPSNAQDEEYPREKVDPDKFGVYDDQQPDFRPGSTVQPSPNLLDVSRFITLPPPYPRHYPALNNSHPDLADYRMVVRSLSEMSEMKVCKSRHVNNVEALRKEHQQKLAEGRRLFKNRVQTQIADGAITYAEAAEAEEALRVDERQTEKETLQAEFDTLQHVVIKPLHEMMNDRLVQLTASIGHLTEKLLIDAKQQNPDRAQQEGDDMPELLEYLTQFKWLFETREQIHKEVFDLLTERNDKYKAIVLLPYRQADNTEKLHSTEEFFARDKRDRKQAFYQDSLDRHQELFNVIEDCVARGVETQSSAFWDIAPALLETVQKMPADVTEITNLAIPEQEYLENPSYYRFPQQYLFTLLDHAEKSTYQFIESQVNLHCLLHEVKSSLLVARCRHMEVANLTQPDTPKSATLATTAEYRAKEEANLTTELKQKVSMIEEQWLEALGARLQSFRDCVKAYLEDCGGWEEFQQIEE